jgi:hypothetical protein
VVVKDLSHLCGALMRSVFEAKNAEMVFGRTVFRDGRVLRYPVRNPLLHLAREVSVMGIRNFGDEKWGGGSQAG